MLKILFRMFKTEAKETKNPKRQMTLWLAVLVLLASTLADAYTDANCLSRLFISTSGESSWFNRNSWNTMIGPETMCSLRGIVCTPDGQVRQIHLPGNGIVSPMQDVTLPICIKDMQALEYLNISGNAFKGRMPDLPATLTVLDATRNSFTTLPSNLCSLAGSLQMLLVADNPLTAGQILDCLTNVESVDLGRTGLSFLSNKNAVTVGTGTKRLGLASIPAPGVSLELPAPGRSNLVYLDMSNMGLTGTISSDGFKTLLKGTDILLSTNELEGTVDFADMASGAGPDEYKNLRLLDLSKNKFKGLLDGVKDLEALLSKMSTKITVIDLSNNALVGIAPNSNEINSLHERYPHLTSIKTSGNNLFCTKRSISNTVTSNQDQDKKQMSAPFPDDDGSCVILMVINNSVKEVVIPPDYTDPENPIPEERYFEVSLVVRSGSADKPLDVSKFGAQDFGFGIYERDGSGSVTILEGVSLVPDPSDPVLFKVAGRTTTYDAYDGIKKFLSPDATEGTIALGSFQAYWKGIQLETQFSYRVSETNQQEEDDGEVDEITSREVFPNTIYLSGSAESPALHDFVTKILAPMFAKFSKVRRYFSISYTSTVEPYKYNTLKGYSLTSPASAIADAYIGCFAYYTEYSVEKFADLMNCIHPDEKFDQLPAVLDRCTTSLLVGKYGFSNAQLNKFNRCYRITDGVYSRRQKIYVEEVKPSAVGSTTVVRLGSKVLCVPPDLQCEFPYDASNLTETAYQFVWTACDQLRGELGEASTIGCPKFGEYDEPDTPAPPPGPDPNPEPDPKPDDKKSINVAGTAGLISASAVVAILIIAVPIGVAKCRKTRSAATAEAEPLTAHDYA